jgi:hypothetical protein
MNKAEKLLLISGDTATSDKKHNHDKQILSRIKVEIRFGCLD